jgi:hypothetical protein
MASRELVQTALRVLSAWISGSRPNSSDVEILREHAHPGKFDLPVDDLACLIIRRESERELHNSHQEPGAAKRVASFR